jgi:tRNA wybutosine-synthesizing protein 4
MLKKRDVVHNTTELSSMLNNIRISSEEDILLRSDEYLQLGCDLRDLRGLQRSLSTVINVQKSLVLLTAEVSITYMDVEAADALIQWAATLPYGEHGSHGVSPPLTITSQILSARAASSGGYRSSICSYHDGSL